MFVQINQNLYICVLFDVSFNVVKKVTKNCFFYLKKLKLINLSHNHILELQTSSFHNISSFLEINLENNLLSTLKNNVFTNINKIVVLKLCNNLIQNIHRDTIYTINYQLCCIKPPNTVCTCQKHWFQTCSKLISSFFLKCIFMFITTCIIMVSSMSYVVTIVKIFDSYKISKLCRKGRGVVHDIIMCSLNINSFVFGFYFIIIVCTDYFYGDSFVVNDIKWKKSTSCFLSFLFILNFSFLEPLLITFLSFCRFMVVKYPFGRNLRKNMFSVTWTVAIISLTTIVSICTAFMIKLFL